MKRAFFLLGLAAAWWAGSQASPLVAAETQRPQPRLVATSEPDWPQFRGPRRDGISDERGLLQKWPEGGPKALWSTTNLGRGFSSPIIAGGRIYLSGDVGEELHVFALGMDGQRLWSATNGLAWMNPYPGARATAAYAAGKLYLQNAHGRVTCFDAANGKELWAVDLLAKFGGKNITWGLSECLLVDDTSVYAEAGGSEALLVALDRNTGNVRWKSAPLLDSGPGQPVENASYVSPILVDYAGRRLWIGCSLKHLVCADAATGKILWKRRIPTNYSVLAMMPALVGDGIFMTAPHGPPGKFYRFVPPTEPGGDPGVEDGWTTRLDTCQGGVIHVDGRIYGSFYPGRKGWAALDATDGRQLYDAPDFVKGAGLWADGRLYAYSENGWMRLLEPTAEKFEVRGEFRFAEAGQNDAWAHPVIHQGRLYLRYHERLVCFGVGR